MIGAQNFLDHAISSIIHQEDSKENNYNYFNRFNPQIQYSFMNLRGFVDRQVPRPAFGGIGGGRELHFPLRFMNYTCT
jgi:hypothetical protein